MRAVLARLFVFVLVATAMAGGTAEPVVAARDAGPVAVWLTDPAADVWLEQQPDVAFANRTATGATVIAVDERRTYQSMVGFGASFTDSSAWLVGTRLPADLREALMHELFSRDGGIGLSMIRQPMGASDFSVTGNYSYDDVPPGMSDPDLSEFTIAHDEAYIIPLLLQAQELNPQLAIMASPWSPPAWMKTTDSMIGGSLRADARQPFADYFVRFIQAYEEAGVEIDYLTPQNEPLFQPGGYPGMLMVAEEQRDWLRDNLGPALATAGIDTDVLAYDHNWDVPSYPETVYADPSAAATVAGTAWHCYGGEVGAQGAVHNAYPNEEAHHTECSGGEWQGTQRAAFDVTMALVINAPRNWARSVVLWNMALDDANGPTNGGCLTCRGVVTVHDTPQGATYSKTLDYYALGHASRFVVPGALRIGSTSPGMGSVQAVAYRNPDGSDVLVAHNAGAERRTFEVAWGRSSFSYALEPGAAATFVWSGRQQGATPGFDALAGSVDVRFGNPDGSSVLLSYGAAEARYQHTIASGQRSLSYSLPVGASVTVGTSETLLSRAGWTATASSSAGGDPPANALDGDPGTRWSSGHGQTNGDWFSLDFGAPQTFDGLLVDATGSTGDFARGYQVYVSDDGVSWGSAIASGPGSGQLLRVVFEPVTARHVRIVATGSSGNWWSIGEVNAFTSSGSTAAPAPDQIAGVQTRAFNAPGGAKAFAVYNPTGAPVVFRVATWDGRSITYTLPAGAAAIFTFQGARGGQDAVPPAPTTTGIEPASGLPGAGVVLSGANLGTSQGSSTVAFGGVPAPVFRWTDTSITTAAPDGSSPGSAPVTVIVAGQTSNSQPFTVLSAADAVPRDAWVVTASSSAAGEPPSNMIDGDIGTRWSSGTGMVPGMSVTVDMTHAQTFSQVAMDSGASGGDYARGWEISVSDDGVAWSAPIASGTGSGRVVTASFAPQTARFFRVVETVDGGGFWWSIAELYAFP